MRGRKPKPTNLKILHGNPGRRPISADEPEFEAIEKPPKPPKMLGRVGRRVWRSMSPELVAKGLLTTMDLGAFADYCIACERVEAAQIFIKKHGTKYPIKDAAGNIKSFGVFPEVHQLNNFMGQKKSIGASFGFSPSDRTRIKVEGQKKENPFAGLGRRKKAK